MRIPGSAILVTAIALQTLSLQGCSNAAVQWPWTRQANESQSLLDLQESNTGEHHERSTPPPRLLEPEASGLRPESKSQVAECQLALALPAEQEVPADPTNFGTRYTQDAWGRRIAAAPLIIVLHETVLGAKETISLFQTPHPRDEDQVSYHMLIDRDGSRLRIVGDEQRAFGAGMSAFGDVTQRIRPGSAGSINNVALHVSLVSPSDGREDTDAHSGYTDKQYASLAGQILLWQATYGIPLTRVTTHSAVDRSRSRYDPRSFRWDRFDAHYRTSAKLCGMSNLDNKQAGL